jgi:hypothetical protein
MKMPNKWIDFVRSYSNKNNISWNCALCEIKEKNLYKPLDKKKQKEEEKKKNELLSEKMLMTSIKSFKKRYAEIKSYDDFYYVKSAFFNRSKEFQERVKQKDPEFFEKISEDYIRDDEEQQQQQQQEEEKPIKKPITKFIPTTKKYKQIKNIKLIKGSKEGEVKITPFILPPPIKAPEKIELVVENIEDKLKELGKIGKEKGAVHYSGIERVLFFSYIAVLNKFKGECVVVYKDKRDGMYICLKINTIRKRTYILDNVNNQLTNFGLALKKCIDRNVSVICIYLDLSFG